MPPLETPKELAIRLLRENDVDIGLGIYKLAVKMQPAWRAVASEAFGRNAVTLLGAVERYMSGGDVDILLKLARDLMKVRKLGGFTGGDFNVLMHVYMPVIRKAFLSRAPTVRQGLAAYDAAESVLLPLVARLVEASAKVDETTAPDARPAFARPFEEVSVNDEIPEFLLAEYADFEEEDEPTSPRAKVPKR